MEGESSQGGNIDDNVVFLRRNYRLGKALGIGAFGKVKSAVHIKTGQKVAIKVLNQKKMKTLSMEEKVRREMKILKLFMHPHIIRFYEVIETPTEIYVVMEYAKSGELFDYIVEKGRLNEDEARMFFQQIISGVEYCHRNMVAHRDLKPENLLLDSNHNVKIADFGLSNVMRDGHFLKTSCGSPNYAAPEVISGKLYAGPEVDVWSCGIILYALLCGTLPFDDENIPFLYKKIKGGIYTLPSHLPPGAKDLIRRMLEVDPLKRITIPEIRQHKWFQAHLPPYLAVQPPDTSQQVNKIDEEIVKRVVIMGFDRKQLIEALLNRHQNEGTVAYHLLYDSQLRVSSGNLGDNKYNLMLPDDATPPVIEQQYLGPAANQGNGYQRKWVLGLQSKAHPREIIFEVLKALQVLNVGWKEIGSFNLKCRWIPAVPGHHDGLIHNRVQNIFGGESNITENGEVSGSPYVLKFELKLYKAHEGKYLLDMQRVKGPQMVFLDFCAAFLAQLGVL